MALWGDNQYVTFLEKENAELKEQNKKLVDAILLTRGGVPINREAHQPRPVRVRTTLNDLRKRLEAKERAF